jgi:hypothetical protein
MFEEVSTVSRVQFCALFDSQSQYIDIREYLLMNLSKNPENACFLSSASTRTLHTDYHQVLANMEHNATTALVQFS